MSRGDDRHRLGAVPRRRQPHLLTSRIAYLLPVPDAAWARPVLYDAFCTPCLVSAVVSLAMIAPPMDEVWPACMS